MAETLTEAAELMADEQLKALAQEMFAEVTAGAAIPVNAGLQAQGDVFIIPLEMAKSASFGVLKPIGKDGQVVVPQGIGGHEHRLFAGADSEVLYAQQMSDRARGNIAVIRVKGEAFLLHHGEGFSLGEHQAIGIADGWYALRQQRERAAASFINAWQRVAD